MKLLEAVGLELARRYTYSDVDVFFASIGVSTANIGWGDNGNSKKNYSKAVLARLADDELQHVAAELDLAVSEDQVRPAPPPANWVEHKHFRLFISHISKDKQTATRLKAALSIYSISGFVAHEDILPTLIWREEIERALQTMDAFLAVHTRGFSASNWTQQEVGFALGKGIKVISFKYGEDPTGFIGAQQALPRLDRTAEQIAKEINSLLGKDPRTRGRLNEVQEVARERGNAAALAARKTAAVGDPGRPDVSVGVRVAHSKFGQGTIIGIDTNKLDIQFDLVGPRRVLDSFVKTLA